MNRGYIIRSLSGSRNADMLVGISQMPYAIAFCKMPTCLSVFSILLAGLWDEKRILFCRFFLTMILFLILQNIFDEIDGRIDGIGADIYQAFISPQLLIGTFSAYLALKYYRNRTGYDQVLFKNLKYHYMYGAAHDVLETYDMLGWVSPIFSQEKLIAPMLLPMPKEMVNERKNSLVHFSECNGSDFATNVPALIQLLIFWLSKKKKLR